VKVEGLTRRQIKERVIEHLKTTLSDMALGLRSQDETGKLKNISAAESDAVFVDNVPEFMVHSVAKHIDDESDRRRLSRLEQKMEQLIQALEGTQKQLPAAEPKAK
jgi:hypothetical protein